MSGMHALPHMSSWFGDRVLGQPLVSILKPIETCLFHSAILALKPVFRNFDIVVGVLVN
jgi:hypothetical protein